MCTGLPINELYYSATRAYCSIILWHSSAQFLHSSAQLLQYANSLESLSHSSAHAEQISKQALQSIGAFSAPMLISLAAALQTIAHSLVSAMQRERTVMSFSLRHSVAQRSHSAAQSLHALIQSL
jgi:hypothetical protein